MICLSCRTGADMVTAADTMTIEEGAQVTGARDLVVKLHAGCRGCECQHRYDLERITASQHADGRPVAA